MNVEKWKLGTAGVSFIYFFGSTGKTGFFFLVKWGKTGFDESNWG